MTSTSDEFSTRTHHLLKQRNDIRLFLSFGLILFFFGCGGGDDNSPADGDTDLEQETEIVPLAPPDEATIPVLLDTSTPVAEVDEKFLSFAIDTSQVVGGHWWSEDGEGGAVGSELCDPFDFSRERLHALAAPLAPAFLRIGGSEADVVQYDLSDNPPDEATEPFHFVFTKNQWDAVNAFAKEFGFELFFTLNAGPGCRDEEKQWNPECVKSWMQYTIEQRYPVTVWELGNEINGYSLFHGTDWSIPGAKYAEDMKRLQVLRDEIDPSTPIAGPSCAFWPDWGEMAAIYPDFITSGGGDYLDIITWHFYPQQSDRCPLQSLPAEEYTMLDPENLDEIATWADQVEALRDEHAPTKPVWLGESGNAQCGGARGISDRFVSSFWWLDELGQMARRGQPIVVRQSLSGSDYGMIRDSTLEPNPDYWLSLFWKRLMGERVLEVSEEDSTLRTYSHCLKNSETGGVTVMLLNIDRNRSKVVALPDLPLNFDTYVFDASDLLGREIRLNGVTLTLPETNEFPDMEPVARQCLETAWFEMPPATIAFLVFEDATIEACQ